MHSVKSYLECLKTLFLTFGYCLFWRQATAGAEQRATRSRRTPTLRCPRRRPTERPSLQLVRRRRRLPIEALLVKSSRTALPSAWFDSILWLLRRRKCRETLLDFAPIVSILPFRACSGRNTDERRPGLVLYIFFQEVCHLVTFTLLPRLLGSARFAWQWTKWLISP